MDAQDLARYHTSAESLAAELATRKAMTDSGLSDAEIDRALLVGHLQGVFLGRWLGAVLFAVFIVWLIGLISLAWAAVAVAIWVPIAFIGARISARRAASAHSWFRVHGGGWTAVARPSAVRRVEQFEPFRIQWAWIGFALVMALLLWAQVSDIWRMIFG